MHVRLYESRMMFLIMYDEIRVEFVATRSHSYGRSVVLGKEDIPAPEGPGGATASLKSNHC